jgi:acetyl-CoA carboxylase biotin carboxyl carrier protein
MATSIEAQIAGRVFRIEVVVGDAVDPGTVVAVLESMKMEVPVEAPQRGRVEAVRVREGDAVEEGDVLVVLA